MKGLRTAKRWSAEQLAEAMQREGCKWTRSVVANLENDRRPDVSVAEVFALAHIFQVSPLVLLLPEDNTDYEVTSNITTSARTVFEWLVGERLPPLPQPGESQDYPDEDRATAWHIFRRKLGYVPEASAHWLVNAELESLRQEGQRREVVLQGMVARQVHEQLEDLRKQVDKLLALQHDEYDLENGRLGPANGNEEGKEDE